MKCKKCNYDYPDEILAPMTVVTPTGAAAQASLCGICALDVINNVYSIKRKKFNDGSIAEHNRQAALRIRKAAGGVE